MIQGNIIPKDVSWDAKNTKTIHGFVACERGGGEVLPAKQAANKQETDSFFY